jgi:hypothetical protein
MANQFPWKTQELKVLLETLPNVSVEIEEQGGDYDTQTLRIERDKSTMYLCGWRPEDPISTPKDCLVDFVLLNDSQKEGLFRSNLPTVEATTLYVEIDELLEATYGKNIIIDTCGYKQIF